MVLAAGLGTRLRPLTLERPKPLIPVGGKPMIDHALDRLAAAGIATAVVNTHYLGAMIAAHLAPRRQPRILLSPEVAALETGGGIRNALPLLGAAPVVTVNADMLWRDGPEPALSRLIRGFDPAVMDALLLLVPVAAAFGYDGPGDYAMAADGRLTRRRAAAAAPLVFAGITVVTPRLYAAPDLPAVFSSTLVWDRAEAAGRLHGLVHDGAWYHVGTPAALAETERRLAAAGGL